ncbi:MAG: DUF2199 domain-containing protein [Planctomycetaceae bacterium]|nr:DUF2199 domain-containing protein [Planctomycetaceae bacterium]
MPELAFQRPDEVWMLEPAEKERRVKDGDDLCILSGTRPAEAARHFIRGLIELPIVGVDDTWAVGVWAEVSKHDYERYEQLYREDATQEPRFRGIVSNSPSGFEDVLGAEVMVQLGTASSRPAFWFVSEPVHSLAELQRNGISLDRIHQVIG